MVVHVVAHLTVNDAEAYEPYADAFMPILQAHGGRVITVDDDAEIIDGAREPGRTVVLEFDSEDAFRGWWDSPEYREIAAVRKANSTTHSIVLDPPTVLMRLSRRRAMQVGAFGSAAWWLAACSGDDGDAEELTMSDGSFFMPAEEEPHAATWMCFPGRRDVWGRSLLADVQQTIATIGLTIAGFEPVRMLVAPDDRDLAADLVGSDIELIDAPVDDLWARDTLPLFLVNDAGDLAAGRVRFNGWGGKQVHDGDEQLAEIVADILGLPLIDSGLVGEGGGLEVDGHGTVLAARSSWVNDNRNPGLSEEEIGQKLAALLGAERTLWVDGVAGQDITDGHIDTLARFADAATIIHEVPSYVEPGEVWYDVAIETAAALEDLQTIDREPYDLVTLRQPETIRGSGDDFLSSFVNYYVCNGAVIVPEFGDASADAAAAEIIGDLHPGREVVALNIDPVASGGGGIHCATQQQPAV